MARITGAASGSDADELERSLLRRGVGTLEADRSRCIDCGRTPLVGEHVYLYASGSGIVCELCSVMREEQPVAGELVRHSERGLAVRIKRASQTYA
jgi:hypothetical protein